MSHNPVAYVPTFKAKRGKGPRTRKAAKRLEARLLAERLADQPVGSTRKDVDEVLVERSLSVLDVGGRL